MPLVKQGSVWVEQTPDACPEGHKLAAGSYLVGWDGTGRFAGVWCAGRCDSPVWVNGLA